MKEAIAVLNSLTGNPPDHVRHEIAEKFTALCNARGSTETEVLVEFLAIPTRFNATLRRFLNDAEQTQFRELLEKLRRAILAESQNTNPQQLMLSNAMQRLVENE